MRRADVLWDFENRLSQKAAEWSGIKAGISKKMGMTASIIFNETMIDEMSDAWYDTEKEIRKNLP